MAIPVTVAIADRAAILRQAQGLKLPDALIAATALESDLALITRDAALAAAIDTDPARYD